MVGSLAERMWAKVDRSGGPIACWPWHGSTNGFGHGRIGSGPGRPLVIASRVAWEDTYGPIPAGLYVLHACDNPGCCNPAHLMVGSLRANSIDAGRKGRLGTGKHATHCKRGHAFEGNTYIHPVTGRRTCQTCIKIRSLARPSTAMARHYGHATAAPDRLAADALDRALGG